jgi:hypothetical protein
MSWKQTMPTTVALLQKLLLTLALAAVAGCATSPPAPEIDFKADYDFQQIETLAFLPQSGSVSGDSPEPYISDIAADRINTGIIRALEAKGFRIIDEPEQADAWISWHLVTREKTDIRTYQSGPTYGGYRGYNRAAFYSCWTCSSNVTVRQYTQGSFFVDVIDPDLKRSVFRSLVVSRLKGQVNRDQAEYDAAAARILAGFPPS